MVQGASGSASGGQLEEKVDLSAETEAKIAQGRQLVEQNQLQEALTLLAALEKKCRVGNDSASLAKVCEASLNLCREAQDQEALLTTLTSLANRRSQKMAAVKALVRTAMPWCVKEPYEPLPATTEPEKEFRAKLVNELRDISDGKIYLERERAQLTRVLATIKEQDGDISGAADTLQEVHVETYGSLSKRDKVEFILEQMRLTLGKQDYVRAAIVASKVSRKHLQEENMEEYKVKFFDLMTDYHRHDKDALELAKDFHAIYSTPHILKDDAKWKEALQSAILFLLLAPYGNEQQDMMNRVNLDTNLEKLPAFNATLKLFLKKEIIGYPLDHQAELEAVSAFRRGGADTVGHWQDVLHRRVIQHNIRVVSVYYKRIHGQRLAQLLRLDPERVEREISTMVSDGTVYAKIDRPHDVVRFSSPQNAEAVLTHWAADIDKLLNLVETTTHLIHKEHMVKS